MHKKAGKRARLIFPSATPFSRVINGRGSVEKRARPAGSPESLVDNLGVNVTVEHKKSPSTCGLFL